MFLRTLDGQWISNKDVFRYHLIPISIYDVPVIIKVVVTTGEEKTLSRKFDNVKDAKEFMTWFLEERE